MLFPYIKNIKLVNEWNKPFNLSIGDYISFPYLNVKNNDSIIIKNDNFLSKLKDVKKFMRLLGYYVAEGFCDNKRIGFAFNKNEIEYHEDVSKLMKELFGLDVHYTKRENNNCYILRFYSVELCKIFSRFNKKEKMAIKNTWLNLSNDYLKQFFIGYFRGDGSDSMNIYTCATISENLFNQLRYVLNRFNIIYNISIHNARIDKKGVNHKKCYFITVTNYEEIKKLNVILGHNINKKLKLIRNTVKFYKNYFYRSIRNINKIKYNGYVYNLEVEDDNSYVGLDGCFHNCFIKDYAAFRELYGNLRSDDVLGKIVLRSIEDKNIELLKESGKDLDLLDGVYGKSTLIRLTA